MSGQALRILVIDDDQVDRAMVRRHLNTSGLKADIVEAASGVKGLELAHAHLFDCVLLDYRLPDIEAVDMLKALLASPAGNHTVLILTGETDQEIAFRLMQAGALDYLSKSESTPSSLARSIRYARARRAFLVELEAARREAEEKSRALDQLNKQKNLLFSIIAHDLRNTFQSLLGSSATLQKAAAKNDIEAIARRAQGLSASASQAHALMEGLFTWANLQLDTVMVRKVDIDLQQIAEEAIANGREMAEDKGLALKADCSGISVLAHREMLFTVLRNLVSNAIKFTPSGGAITISAQRRESRIEIEVTDTGVGIASARVDTLFTLDHRVTTPGTAGERGSGLGLLLCHELIERQGGQLSVNSTLGQGTTFTLSLPQEMPFRDASASSSGGPGYTETP